MGSARILIISNGALCRNPRVVKEATALGETGYEVTVLTIQNHRPSESIDKEILVSASFRRETLDLIGRPAARLGARFSRWLSIRLLQHLDWQSPETLGPAHALLKKARGCPADLTIVHNEVPHWIGTRLMTEGRRVAADIEDWHSEDLLPEDRRHRPLRLLRHVEGLLLSNAAYTSTTSEALADALHARYGGNRPEVIANSFPLQPAPVRLTSNEPPVFFWFSQTIGPGRGLESFLAAWQRTRQPSRLVLLGDPTPGYDRDLIRTLPQTFQDRVTFRPLVSPAELPATIAVHDIGLALEQAAPLSRDLTITNKILQYLNAGLAVVASNTAGQREVFARAPEIGLLVENQEPSLFAQSLDALLSDRARLARCQRASRSLAETHYHWGREAPRLVKIVTEALKKIPRIP